jgi:hypothetical protein
MVVNWRLILWLEVGEVHTVSRPRDIVPTNFVREIGHAMAALCCLGCTKEGGVQIEEPIEDEGCQLPLVTAPGLMPVRKKNTKVRGYSS